MLITEADVSRVDNSKVHLIYEQWPEHFKTASKIKTKLDHTSDYYKEIVLCGVGGSATSCDVLCDLVNDSGIAPAIVARGEIPSSINKHSLVIVNSVSGNTRESVEMMEAASKKNAEVICISAGGKLKELSDRNGSKHVNIPNFSLPRASLPYLIMPGLRLMNPFLDRSIEDEIDKIPRILDSVAKGISFRTSQETNVAKQIAHFLENGFAFCFTSPYLLSVGTRFKNSLNENAKIHCLKESILEASHNEIVPFTYDNKLSARVLFLRWVNDRALVKERFEKVNRLFTGINQPVMDVTADESTLLSAMIASIYILDYATIYKAILRRLDPSPTPAIEILKNS